MRELGTKESVKVFVRECRDIGLDLGSLATIKKIAEKPEWITVLLSYSELGLLKRLGQAINNLKE